MDNELENSETKKELIEALARRLHEWYLEAVKELNTDSYNQNACKPFNELTEEQKSIDRYIARKILESNFVF